MEKIIYTGEEMQNKYGNIQNDSFHKKDLFELNIVPKEQLYDNLNVEGERNLVSYDEWNNDSDNYDGYHTETIDNMIEIFNKGETLPPLIVDENGGLFDGSHRLTAFSSINTIKEISVLKRIKKFKI